ncbi:MAG: terpene utilization protein AtuA [Gammaproteobacteria bacterium TMED180]|nr:MAG: terpene utilization protein AtuA [Gammaproteobacteria bacterium TMED180]
MTKDLLKIGGASGYWGDASQATEQLLKHDDLDFIVYDYLAEITMAILARVKAKDQSAGYATDFISEAMVPNLSRISETSTKIISNAGGVNPSACAMLLREKIAEQGLSLKVAVIEGDNLLPNIDSIFDLNPTEMFSGNEFPDKAKIGSINAYFGAQPIVKALEKGADIVVTGRCVDSAVTLAACMYNFGWPSDDFDLLSAGSLIGHLLECGTQITGGNFTDWKSIKGTFDQIGYPIAEIEKDGKAYITKAKDTGGVVSFGTVAEQMLYEIGDPENYLLPDVNCDFSQVEIKEIERDRVYVSGARGKPPSESYKVCLTYEAGFRGGHLFGFYGSDATDKANAFAKAAISRSRYSLEKKNLEPFIEESVEIIGSGSQFGTQKNSQDSNEVFAKIAVKHESPKGVGIFLKDATGLGLSSPPGLSGFAGARPKPSPILSLFSFLYKKENIGFTLQYDNFPSEPIIINNLVNLPSPNAPGISLKPNFSNLDEEGHLREVSLEDIAWGRSGDKGNKANVGIIARHPNLLPYIWETFSENKIADIFSHFLENDKVDRHFLPGISGINFVLHEVLGGGGTSSLRNDPQGKGYAQILLSCKIKIPENLLV